MTDNGGYGIFKDISSNLSGTDIQDLEDALYKNKNSIIELSNTIDANTAA
jgi:hypothetical protein